MALRVVSLVPSWTETLVACGCEVVGRTRYCIHPVSAVESIPLLGGTKSLKIDLLKSLAPDLVVMDREENTKEMADACGCPILDTHVRSLEDLPRELRRLHQALHQPALQKLERAWTEILQAPRRQESSELPGLIQWWRPPEKAVEAYVYVIWRKPWMAVHPQSFIGSLCDKLGLPLYQFSDERSTQSYPEFRLEELEGRNLGLLLSSEPYPFGRKRSLQSELSGWPVALVDGESYSWFGLRSARFLVQELGLEPSLVEL